MNWQKKLSLLGAVGLISVTSIQAADIGQPLSPCSLTELSNSEYAVDLSHFKGKVIYLDFWASWCPPCAKSFPFLNAMHQQYQAQGLHVIGVNLDEKLEDAEQFLHQYPAEFSLVSDLSKQCAKTLGVAAMPSSYLIDRKGNIRHIHLGFRASETQELRKKVEQLLSEPVL